MYKNIVFVLSFIGLVASQIPDYQKTIKSYLQQYSAGDSNLCDNNECCVMSSTETCDISSFKKDSTMLVLPGGETRCIFSTSTQYAFQVIPGANDKLLFYFQGGGACWSESTTTSDFCTTDCVPQSPDGIFDRSNVNNKYADYTIVHALYCSGDIWAGDVTRDYDDSAGVPVTQVGLINAQTTLDWVKQQQDNKLLASTFSDLVVMGCSAGSIGTQVWASTILDTLSWSKAAVIPDSYAAVFPDGSQGMLIYQYGLCSWSGLPSSLYDSCLAQTLTLQDMNAVLMKQHANVPYAFLQSKIDDVQIAFYKSVAVSMGYSPILTPGQFYAEVNDIFSVYSKENKNFVSYLVDGSQHCFTPLNLVFTADGLGPADNNSTDNTGIMMNDWIGEMPLSNGQAVDTLCLGEVMDNEENKVLNYDYCSSTVVPKEYIEQY